MNPQLNPKFRFRALCFVVFAAGVTASCAQRPALSQAVPAAATATKATSLLPADALAAFKLSGAKAADAQVTPVAADQPDFQRALRVVTLVQPQKPYEIQLTARTAAPVAKGDVLLATFWARTITSPIGEGFVGITFEQAMPEYTRSFGFDTSAGTQWKRFDFPFRSVGSYAPGEAMMNLRVGFAPQTIEIAGVSLQDYGADADLNALPATKMSYAGIEPDAPWRAAAQQRIEKYRKGDLKIVVRDAAGQPVPGAQITVTQTRQAFAFGSAVNAQALVSDDAADLKYQAVIKANFNRIVFENDLKWARWQTDRETPPKALQWLRANGIQARGHVLVWPSWRHLPAELKNLENDPAALQSAVDAHITDEASSLRGQLHDWDVLNEPYKNHDLMDILGPQSQVEWFQKAHQADPAATLYVNDYGILAGGGRDADHQGQFESTIAYLLQAKAPLGGIGIQGHFGSNLTPPQKMLDLLDRYAKFGLPIQITEFDVQVPNETLQADFTRDFLTVMFSHPSVTGVVMWGFWESRHYAPQAALWRKDWTPKPNAKVWMDLVGHQWRTDLTAKSGADGALQTRAFLGDYQIRVEHAGKTELRDLTLPATGATLEVEVE